MNASGSKSSASEILGLLLVFSGGPSVIGAPFQNLDFENARTNSLRPGFNAGERFGPAADLLPGWRLSLGTNLLTSIGYNLDRSQIFVDSGGATITDLSIEGQYSLRLDESGKSDAQPFSLSQRGDIPEFARVLAFTHSNLPFVASINGVELSPQPLRLGRPDTVFADISRFAGQNVELMFRPIGTPTVPITGPHTIDSIAFLVPEPSTNALLVLGALALAGRWFWMSRPRRK